MLTELCDLSQDRPHLPLRECSEGLVASFANECKRRGGDFIGRVDDYDEFVLYERPKYVPHGYAQRLRQFPDRFDSQSYIFDVTDTLIGEIQKYNVSFYDSLL